MVVCLAAAAHAEGEVGVVVVGTAPQHDQLAVEIGRWLEGHGSKATGDALDRDATRTIENCLSIQDHACARQVVEKRGHADSVVFALLEPTKTQTINLTVYWILKGRELAALRRPCEDCTAGALAGTVDAIMTTLASTTSPDQARLTISSKPPGTSVLIDHVLVGTTPITRDLAAGTHVIELMHGTRLVGERSVQLHAGEEADVVVPVRIVADEGPPSRVPAIITLGAGVAALATGAALYATSEKDDGSKPTYRDTRPAGIAVGAAGLALTALGTVLWLRAGHSDSAPVTALIPHGGIVGWVHAF